MQYLLIAMFAILLSGCAKVVLVEQEDTKLSDANRTFQDLPGLPFYIKKEVFVQTTSYKTTWLNATMTVKKYKIGSDNKEVEVDSKTFNKFVSKKDNGDFDNLKKHILSLKQIDDIYMSETIGNFLSIKDVDISAISPEIIENKVEAKWIVGKEKYYLNSYLPWFGSNEFSFKPNADGTLGETSSKVDTKLAEALTSLLPIKEFFQAKIPATEEVEDSQEESSQEEAATEEKAKGSAAKQEIKYFYKIMLDSTEVGQIKTFSKTYDVLPKTSKPLTKYDTEIFSISEYPTIKQDTGKKVETTDIGLAGTISIPKE